MSDSLLGGSDGGNAAPPASQNGNPPTTQTPAVDWKASLPEDLRSEPSLQSIKEIGDLAKSYIHAQKMVGKDKIVVPDKFATPDDWRKNVFNKLGLPETEDKYDFKVKEGSKLDADFIKGFKAEAFKNGILPHQAEQLAGWYDEKMAAFESTYSKTMEDNTKANIESLKKEWGAGFEKNVKIANVVLEKFADPEIMEHLKNSGFANDTKLVKLLHKMGAAVLDDKVLGDAINTNAGLSPEDAKIEVNKIIGDKNHPYFNSLHASHKDAVAEVQRLYGFMFQE